MTHPILENWSDISTHAAPSVFQPETESDMQRFLRDGRKACLLAGNGSKWWMGNPALPVEACVDLRRLDRLLEYSPGDLTVTVQAGMPFSRLQETLASEMQTLPVDPPAVSGSTIGGLVAVGLSGPLQQSCGTLRDKVLGIKVIHPDGTITRAGGKVVKNVAGYDLCKLYCGSFGTLAAILEVTFRVFPRAESIRCFSFEVNGLDEACGVWRIVRSLPVNAAGVVYLEEPSQPQRIIIRLRGTERSVQAQLSQIEASFPQGRSAGHDILEAAVEHFYATDSPLWFRLETIPGSLPQAVALLQQSLKPGFLIVDFSSRRCHFSAQQASIAGVEDVRSSLHAHDAALVIEKAPLSMKQQIDVWGSRRDDLFLTREIKAVMDPMRQFNPGRYVTGD